LETFQNILVENRDDPLQSIQKMNSKLICNHQLSKISIK